MPFEDGTSFNMPRDPNEVKGIWKEKAREYGATGMTIRSETRDGQEYLVKEAGGEEIWTPVDRGGKERR